MGIGDPMADGDEGGGLALRTVIAAKGGGDNGVHVVRAELPWGG